MVHPRTYKAVIITALPLEFEAVCHYLKDKEDIRHPKGTIYTKGYFHGGENTWEVLVAEVGKGNSTAAQETERALAFHNPNVALLVGISGGIKDVRLGDVVAADKVYYYESGKWVGRSEGIAEFYPRPMVYSAGYRIIEQAKASARENEWQKLLNPKDRDPKPSAIIGPIAAGESVVASKASDVYELIKRDYGDSVALAMEDYGFLRAAYANSGIEALVVRGVSDLIEGKHNADSEGWQPKAARRASAFAFQVLSELELDCMVYGDCRKQGLLVGNPLQVPLLPEHFIPRPEVSESVKARLLRKDAVPGVLVISAIHGLGGIGKTTLATALAYNEDVQKRFSNGILWTTLGQEPDLLSILNSWIQALGDNEFHPTTKEAASNHLRILLHDKNVLLIVDDAWDLAHVRYFLIGGPLCQMLITTRDAIIAKAIGAVNFDLEVMTPEQSLSLLSKRLGRGLREEEHQEAMDLAKEVGYLPLALELAAAQVLDGVQWRDLQDDLQFEVARLESLEIPGATEIDEATRRKLSLKASFLLSLKRLPIEKLTAFTWLGVLPEDATISQKMAATLWETGERLALNTLRYLRDKSLILPYQILNSYGQTYRLHDLMRDTARNLIVTSATKKQEELPGLGLTLLNAHAKLLERYQKKTQKGQWHTLPDDGYIHNHLLWHMKKAGLSKKIHEVLYEETLDGENAWYHARERLGQTRGFVEDISFAWQLAEESSESNINNGQKAHMLGLEIRYALITASINSISANIPTRLLIQLIENGLWTDAQSLAYVRQIPDLKKRADELSKLSLLFKKVNNSSALKNALEIAREIEDDDERSRAIATIAFTMPDPANAFKMIEEISNEYAKAWLLAKIAPNLPEPLLRDAIKVVREIKDDRYKSLALATMAGSFSEPTNMIVLDEALNSARKIKSVYIRSSALVDIVYHFPDSRKKEILDEALELAIRIEGGDGNILFRPQAVSKVALRLDNKDRALAVAKKITDDETKAKTIAKVASNLPEPKKTEVLKEDIALITKIEWEYGRLSVLSEIAPYLPEPLLNEAFALIYKISDEAAIAKAIAGFIPYLSEPLLKEALALVEKIEDENYRAEALAEIAYRSPEPRKTKTLQEALALARKIRDGYERSIALLSIASCLSEPKRTEYLKESLELIKQIKKPFDKSEALVRIAYEFPGQLQEEILELARKNTDLKYRTLAKISPILSEPDRTQAQEDALESIEELEPGLIKSLALIEIIPYLPVPLLKKALKLVREIKDEDHRSIGLATIAQNLNDPKEAHEIISELKDKSERFMALVKIANKFPEPQGTEFLNEAIKLLEEEEIRFSLEESIALAEIAFKLPEPWRTETLDGIHDWALKLGSAEEYNKSRALVGVATYYPNSDKALAIAQKISYKSERSKALAEIAVKLPEPIKTETLKEALSLARESKDNHARPNVLAKISLHLAKLPPAALYPLWRDTLHILAQNPRQELLIDLSSMICVAIAISDSNDINDIADIFEKIGRWWP